MDEEHANTIRSGMVPLSWRGAATVSLVVAASCLVALVIVAREAAADALATTALALAMISLVSQVLIALLGFYNGTRQSEQFIQLSEHMKAGLSEVRMLASDIADAQSSQIAETMRFFMGQQEEPVAGALPEPEDPSDYRLRMEVLERMLQQTSGGPLARRMESERDVFEALAEHLMTSGYVPRLRGGVDLEWTDSEGQLHRAEVKGWDAVRSRTGFLRAIRSARSQDGLADLFGDGERLAYTSVLALPSEPEFPEWHAVAQDAGVNVVWPDEFTSQIGGS